MKYLFVVLITLLNILTTYSQVKEEWARRYNSGSIDDNATGIAIDINKNVYVTGYNNLSGVTIKYNSAGEQVLVLNHDTLITRPVAIALDNNGNIYVTGQRGFATIGTAKYNSNGILQWVRFRIGSLFGAAYIVNSMAVDNEGNVFITGDIADGATQTGVYLTIKYDTNGNLKWEKTYSPTVTPLGGQSAKAIALDNQGNAYITGNASLSSSIGCIATVKYNSTGIQLWAQTYNGLGSGNYSGQSITLDNIGNVYVAGIGAGKNLVAIKYADNGNVQWTQSSASTVSAGANSIAVDKFGNVFLTGYSNNGSGSDYKTIKYNSFGDLEWDETHNGIGNGEDKANSVAVDELGNAYVTGYSFGGGTNMDYTTIKYTRDGFPDWIKLNSQPQNGDDRAVAIILDDSNNVYVTGNSLGNGNSDYLTIKYSQRLRYPVFIVPGIGGTYAANLEYDYGWLLKRGIEPDSIQIDPLGRSYDDIIRTLENVGYVKNKDLFIVAYDWRLPPGPVDNNLDGLIEGISGTSLTDDQFDYAIDYLGWYIKKACEQWRQDNNEELDFIDIISHSTGGLISRTYIQSDAYGSVYDFSNNYKLPRIRNFVMIAVPNRGATKIWNPIKDNWSGDKAYRFVLSKIVNRAYQKVLQDKIITGPDGNINKSSILDSTGTPNKELFISKYVPTMRSLLATYAFIDFGNGLTTINDSVNQRNTIILDLNNGFDINPLNDPNGFLDSAKVTVIYGSGVATPKTILQRSDFGLLALQSFTDFIPNNALPGTIWYSEIVFENNGDGTVPITSSAGQFLIDTRATVIEFTTGDHTGLVSQINVQSTILDLLNVPYTPANISTGSSFDFNVIYNAIGDPVELFITDGLGRRLGYSNATGALTEIPNSIWFGNTEGMGYIFGPVQEPINVVTTGLGENYYVMVSVEDLGEYGGVVLEGFLPQGEVNSYEIPITPLSIKEINSLIPENFALEQNYPNPFNPSTKISWQAPVGSHQKLKVYDVLGKEVATLVDEFREVGRYEIEFDATNLASGIYFYRLQAGDFVQTRKMILLK